MDKAFDTVMQSEVDAAVIAKISNRFWVERFRYQCLCCGMEVYLAAADSYEVSPHFKHRKGNNDTACERYLGQLGAVERLKLLKNKQEHIEFCFNRDRMTFEICVSLTEEELQVYEEENNSLTVSSKYYAEPFLFIPINKGTFIPGGKNYFTITEFSRDYSISFNSGLNRCTYQDVMRNAEKVNIFRTRMQDERCRHQTSRLLYTDTEYIGISENEETLRELASLEYISLEENLFSFVTENREFYGLRFSVKRAEYSVLSFFQKHDYRIETSESFKILWPPVYVRDSRSICTGDTVYVQSSFELIPHGNINVDDAFAREIDRYMLTIHVDDEVIIHEKNIDISIQKEGELELERVLEEPVTTYSDRYTVPDQYDYFLFDQNGCTRLIPGSNVYLSEQDRIVGYSNGHIKAYVCACPKEKTDIRQLIDDMMKYHPQSEAFEPDDFMDVTTNETVLAYLENCYRSGRINTVVKQYIKEGLI